jgi:peptidoglycan/xylan/chitin deacetylase (PgdA/CDA1 family)
MRTARIVTTSWDDGDPFDLKVAELLRARSLPGTFYVPIVGYDGRKTLEPAELRSLGSGGFEIGAHGVSHNVLTGLSPKELVREVRVCKTRLEDILGASIQMFSYPKGKHNAKVVKQVKDTGYKGARTTHMLRQRLDFDPFLMPTSLLANAALKKLYLKNLVRDRNSRGLLDYLTQFIRLDSWVTMGKALFDQMLNEGGVWHLHGHSWEIEELGLWDQLRQMLDYVSNREGVTYLSNRGVLNFLPANKAPVLVNHRIPSK